MAKVVSAATGRRGRSVLKSFDILWIVWRRRVPSATIWLNERTTQSLLAESVASLSEGIGILFLITQRVASPTSRHDEGIWLTSTGLFKILSFNRSIAVGTNEGVSNCIPKCVFILPSINIFSIGLNGRDKSINI